jgi:hypothetical protein
MVPMRHYIEKLTYTLALRLYRLPCPSQLLSRLGPDWYVAGQGVTILTGKTLDLAVMTTRAEKYH